MNPPYTPCSVAVNGGEPVPCDFEAEVNDGLKGMIITARAALLASLGVRVTIRLNVGDHQADGEGIVTSVRVDNPHYPEPTIVVTGPLREVQS